MTLLMVCFHLLNIKFLNAKRYGHWTGKSIGHNALCVRISACERNLIEKNTQKAIDERDSWHADSFHKENYIAWNGAQKKNQIDEKTHE